MAHINASQSNNTFAPKQALSPTPQLYDELVGDGMEELAKATVAMIGHMEKGSVILDMGCGTGAGTAAVAEAVSNDVLSTLSIQGIDINEDILGVYTRKALEGGWPAQVIVGDAGDLTAVVPDASVTHVVGTALLFVLPNDGMAALKETKRILAPGGMVVLNAWAYVPNMVPIRIASQRTRPLGTPEIRGGMDKWSDSNFLRSTIEKAGFSKDKITLVQRDVYCHAAKLDHYATMLWSFIGGTTPVGWLESDEENREKAIDIVKEELLQTDGFQLLEDGRVCLKFVANIAVATK
ncbi:hypothetical protein E8E11_004795 [Didymella keratinophila]|nr:hypothetical protein E8E11_004795 [Didymella keratinophila]